MANASGHQSNRELRTLKHVRQMHLRILKIMEAFWRCLEDDKHDTVSLYAFSKSIDSCRKKVCCRVDPSWCPLLSSMFSLEMQGQQKHAVTRTSLCERIRNTTSTQVSAAPKPHGTTILFDGIMNESRQELDGNYDYSRGEASTNFAATSAKANFLGSDSLFFFFKPVYWHHPQSTIAPPRHVDAKCYQIYHNDLRGFESVTCPKGHKKSRWGGVNGVGRSRVYNDYMETAHEAYCRSGPEQVTQRIRCQTLLADFDSVCGFRVTRHFMT